METTTEILSYHPQSEEREFKRRSRLETYLDIISVIAEGAQKPTHIMYRANLSWTVMQRYMKILLVHSLVSADDSEGKTLYRLTDRGFGLLKQYLSIKDDLNLSAKVGITNCQY